MISHTCLVQSAIENEYIAIEFDDINGGVKTKKNKKVLLRVYFHEQHREMQKRMLPGFP